MLVPETTTLRDYRLTLTFIMNYFVQYFKSSCSILYTKYSEAFLMTRFNPANIGNSQVSYLDYDERTIKVAFGKRPTSRSKVLRFLRKLEKNSDN